MQAAATRSTLLKTSNTYAKLNQINRRISLSGAFDSSRTVLRSVRRLALESGGLAERTDHDPRDLSTI